MTIDNNPKYIFLPDTSVIVNGQFLKHLRKQETIDSIVLSRVVLAEIEHQANQGRATGLSALDELKFLRDFAAEKMINIVVDGERPRPSQIKYAHEGELDAGIRFLAEEYYAILVTSDKVQASLAEIEGLAVVYLKEAFEIASKRIEDYFDETTMSVHLRERNKAQAKKGVPGNFDLAAISDDLLTRVELEEIAKDIVERASRDPESFIESDRAGATIVQLKNTRIIIIRPPFSDAMEITATRPILKRNVADYKIDARLLKRIETKSEGLLIVGAPGAGKSTFATALAEFYADKGRIIKTFENPRDLQVDDRITQLSGFGGDISESADLILLMRPDHTVYDELRKTKDFETYADLRMAGIGLVGVIHGTAAIDGVSRFIKRVDLGVIPSIIDTIIFIENGEIGKVYTLEIKVKLPSGLKERDLSRPVVEVSDFRTKRLEYELYTFGEQVVVYSVTKGDSAATQRPVKVNVKELKKRLRSLGVYQYEFETEPPDTIVLYVSDSDKPRVIGKQGKKVSELEARLGSRIDVRSFSDMMRVQEEKEDQYHTEDQAEFVLEVYQSQKSVHIIFPSLCVGKDVEITINGEVIVQLTVGKTSEVKLAKNSELGKLISDAHNKGAVITALM